MVMLPARIIIMSHLSDLHENQNPTIYRDRLEFIKFMILKFPNTSVEIDADKVYMEYQTYKTNRELPKN